MRCSAGAPFRLGIGGSRVSVGEGLRLRVRGRVELDGVDARRRRGVRVGVGPGAEDAAEVGALEDDYGDLDGKVCCCK